MIKILFEDCCNNCPHIDVDIKQAVSFIEDRITVIGCEHMEVCEKFLEKKRVKERITMAADAHS